MVKILEIHLTNPQQFYYPGQIIEGHVQIELETEQKVIRILLKCRGKGHVFWSEGGGQNRASYWQSENYIDVKNVLFGTALGEKGEATLHAGSHSFPFKFVLPSDLPGSFESPVEKGYVRYWLKAKMQKSWSTDSKEKLPFNVGSSLDLNTIPSTANRGKGIGSKYVCCLCCQSDPITASFGVNKTGFVPGETMVFWGDIQENTGRGVDSSKIKLVMNVTFREFGIFKKQKTFKKTLLDIRRGGIPPRGSDQFNGQPLTVPTTPPSFLKECKIIDIDYTVELEVDVLKTPFDLDVPIDIVIGTVPIQASHDEYTSQFQQTGIVFSQPLGFGNPANIS